ncbi:MAG: type II toxin-antitoxin system PemK/MazF family toxin [Bacteroidales bacterium]|nr:type II toxin-antitoxin system PemK/MazF family toxin [Bacteroidales bacterium]
MNQFNIHIVNLDPTVGAEMQKTRPCIIISPDELNNNLKTVIIAPLTTSQRGLPTRILIKSTQQSRLDRDSYAAIDQLKTVDKSRLSEVVGEILEDEKHTIAQVLKEMFEY